MKEDEIIELAKKEIHYTRHLKLVGKEKADMVMWFWIEGFKKALTLINNHFKPNKP